MRAAAQVIVAAFGFAAPEQCCAPCLRRCGPSSCSSSCSPGPLPGGIAPELYTIGVSGRLGAEVVENADPSAVRALRVGGAGATSAFAYGTVPTVAPPVVSLALYRWEVVLRETVVVALVGAGGLGRLLAQQNAALDEPVMLTTMLALIVAAFVVDLVSGQVRAAVR